MFNLISSEVQDWNDDSSSVTTSTEHDNDVTFGTEETPVFGSTSTFESVEPIMGEVDGMLMALK